MLIYFPKTLLYCITFLLLIYFANFGLLPFFFLWNTLPTSKRNKFIKFIINQPVIQRPSSLTFTMLQELYTFQKYSIFQHDHVLSHVLYERHEVPFGIKPSVYSKLFLIWLQGLDHTWNAKLIVALSTV